MKQKINASSGPSKWGQGALFVLCTLAMAGHQHVKRIGVRYPKQRFRSLETRCQADVHISDLGRANEIEGTVVVIRSRHTWESPSFEAVASCHCGDTP